MSRTAPFPDQDCVWTDLPQRHDFGRLAHSGAFGDALKQSAGGRFEATQNVLLDAVRDPLLSRSRLRCGGASVS